MIDKNVFQYTQGETLTELFSPAEIAKRVQALGNKLTQIYGAEPLLCICVLRGALMFYSDLIRCIQNPRLTLDFVRLSSYGKSSCSSGQVNIEQWISTDVAAKHVLIVEDIVDSGQSMHDFLQKFERQAQGALSVSLATLVDKKERRACQVKVDYSCFQLDSGFLVGYGLDYAERYRNIPSICELTFAQQ